MADYNIKRQLANSVEMRMINATPDLWVKLARLLAELNGWIEPNSTGYN